MSTPLRHEDYRVAWIAVLPVEVEAAVAVLDKQHHGYFESVPGADDYTYIAGEINGHNVVIAKLPAGQNYGTGAAAALVSQVKTRFPIWFALLVGVAAGLPNLSTTDTRRRRDIRLGDVLVCMPDKNSTGLVNYDLGTDTEAGFLPSGRQAETPAIIRSAISDIQVLQKRPFRTGNAMAVLLEQFHAAVNDHQFQSPGQDQDELVDNVDDALGSEGWVLVREPRDEAETSRVWYGNIGSGNTLMRNARRRDQLRDAHDLIGLEMEAAGVCNTLPTGVIRGVCDYGDVYKTKQWQPHAAAVTAVYAKAVLLQIRPKVMSPADQHVNVVHTLPFPRNDDLVVRNDLFAPLEQLLPVKPRYQVAALWGLGGSGKTQIALEFAYRRHTGDQFPVFWVHADNYDKFVQGYGQIASAVRLSPNLQGSDMMVAVKRWLESQPKWLLILDNADSLDLFTAAAPGPESEQRENLRHFIPCGARGSILWTTRDGRAVGDLVGLQQGLHVPNMIDTQAKQLLVSLSGLDVTTDEANVVSELLKCLEHFPLAITQAASYIRETKKSYASYLERYQRKRGRSRLLAVEGPQRYRQDGVRHSVMTTWQITMEHLNTQHPCAHWMLLVMAWYHNRNLPQQLLQAIGQAYYRQAPRRSTLVDDTDAGSDSANQVCSQLKHREREEDCDEEEDDSSDEEGDQIRVACTRLEQFSFLRRRLAPPGFDDLYDMHKLVQEVIRHTTLRSLKKGESPDTANSALDIMMDIFPSGKYDSQAECDDLVAHATVVYGHAELQVRRFDMCEARERLSWYYQHRHRLSEVVKIRIDVLAIRREVLGEKHPVTIASMTALAMTYYAQGRAAEAEEINIEALALYREVLGKKHPATLGGMANLAGTYFQQKRYSEAESILVDVLPHQQKLLGRKHPAVLWCMGILAVTYHDQRRYDESEKIKIDLLSLQREVLGEKHPDTLWTMNSLGTTYFQQGRAEEAEKIFIDAVSLHREVFGDRHPETLRSKCHLAELYRQQGRPHENPYEGSMMMMPDGKYCVVCVLE